MSRLVERCGRGGFAAITSLLWALPMAAWAGSADLSPVDRTAVPRISAAVGAVMFGFWLILLSQLRRFPVSERTRRFALAQMSSAEKRWALVLFLFALGLIAWLNGAATVDWGPLISAVSAGTPRPSLFAAALAGLPVAMAAGIWFSWRKADIAFQQRRSGRSRAGP